MYTNQALNLNITQQQHSIRLGQPGALGYIPVNPSAAMPSSAASTDLERAVNQLTQQVIRDRLAFEDVSSQSTTQHHRI
jgi:hypothetical protein